MGRDIAAPVGDMASRLPGSGSGRCWHCGSCRCEVAALIVGGEGFLRSTKGILLAICFPSLQLFLSYTHIFIVGVNLTVQPGAPAIMHRPLSLRRIIGGHIGL